MYGIACNAQESSLAEPAAIWLGTVDDRMHLTQDQVAKLLPILRHFVTEGTLPSQTPPASSMTVKLDRKLGGIGAAYDPSGPQRAYTFEHQPHNGPAYQLGCALAAANREHGGDTIDAGLHLLKTLQARGFGVFEIEPATPPAPREASR